MVILSHELLNSEWLFGVQVQLHACSHSIWTWQKLLFLLHHLLLPDFLQCGLAYRLPLRQKLLLLLVAVDAFVLTNTGLLDEPGRLQSLKHSLDLTGLCSLLLQRVDLSLHPVEGSQLLLDLCLLDGLVALGLSDLQLSASSDTALLEQVEGLAS